MQVILNVGLNTNTGSTITADQALSQIAIFADVLEHAIAHSDTEQTLIVAVNVNDVRFTVYKLADNLDQDCIAVYYPRTGNGTLVGPKAAAWGTFNPEYFLCLDGTRLAQPVLAAA